MDRCVEIVQSVIRHCRCHKCGDKTVDSAQAVHDVARDIVIVTLQCHGEEEALYVPHTLVTDASFWDLVFFRGMGAMVGARLPDEEVGAEK